MFLKVESSRRCSELMFCIRLDAHRVMSEVRERKPRGRENA